MARPKSNKEEPKEVVGLTLADEATKIFTAISKEQAIRALDRISKKESVVKPLIKVEGEKNLLEELFEETPHEDLPEMISVGFMNLNMGRYTWVSYKMITKGDKVLSIEVSEPDMREIAYESAKIEFEQSMGMGVE